MNIVLDCCELPYEKELLDWIKHLEVVHQAHPDVTDVVLGAIYTGHSPELVMTNDVPSLVVGVQVPLL